MESIKALYDFLGNNTIWGSVDLNHKVQSTEKLDKGIYYDKSKKQASIKPVNPLLDRSRLALIIGFATASA